MSRLNSKDCKVRLAFTPRTDKEIQEAINYATNMIIHLLKKKHLLHLVETDDIASMAHEFVVMAIKQHDPSKSNKDNKFPFFTYFNRLIHSRTFDTMRSLIWTRNKTPDLVDIDETYDDNTEKSYIPPHPVTGDRMETVLIGRDILSKILPELDDTTREILELKASGHSFEKVGEIMTGKYGVKMTKATCTKRAIDVRKKYKRLMKCKFYTGDYRPATGGS